MQTDTFFLFFQLRIRRRLAGTIGSILEKMFEYCLLELEVCEVVACFSKVTKDNQTGRS
jgi:hypothetical protein